MHPPSNRNLDGVQVTRGGDVSKVTWEAGWWSSLGLGKDLEKNKLTT